jgi:hypothetical protein
MAADTWVVTSYFNPCGYRTRRRNFATFLAGLRARDARVLVVELAARGGTFELERGPDVVQLRGGDVLWQKERLLNVAVERLPSTCTKVVWLDCDVLFEDDDWLDATARSLDRHMVVQPFSRSVNLPPGATSRRGDEPLVESFAAAFARDRALAYDAPYARHGHTGFAWAARRELLDCCGLYDACLSGSGDHLMAHVFAGFADAPCIQAMIGRGHRYAEHFARWAVAADRLVAGRLGHVESTALHLWHGESADRRYRDRNTEFRGFSFDPERHLRRHRCGAWRWGDAPPGMEAWAEAMLVSRREDAGAELGQGRASRELHRDAQLRTEHGEGVGDAVAPAGGERP